MESEVRGMSLEAVLPIDLLMDACILTAVQLALGRLHLRRLLRALLPPGRAVHPPRFPAIGNPHCRKFAFKILILTTIYSWKQGAFSI